MRVFLHDLLWQQDAAGFQKRIDRYLKWMSGSGSNRNHRPDACTRAEGPEEFYPRALQKRARRAFALLTRTYSWKSRVTGQVAFQPHPPLALDTNGTWTPDILRKLLTTKQLEWWRRGESEYPQVLKTRNLLIFRDARNAENYQIAPNWNVSGTQHLRLSARIFPFFLAARLSKLPHAPPTGPLYLF